MQSIILLWIFIIGLLLCLNHRNCSNIEANDTKNVQNENPMFYQSCIHDEVVKEESLEYRFITPTSVFKENLKVDSVPLKIKFLYTESFNTESDLHDLEALFEEVADEFQSIIKVKHPADNPLLVEKTCSIPKLMVFRNQLHCSQECRPVQDCSKGVPIPDYLLHGCRKRGRQTEEDGKGINNTQLVILVSTKDNCKSNGPQAFSNECRYQLNTRRPILGSLSLCENNLNLNDMAGIKSAIRHEVIHIMGFSISKFAYFLDPKGKAYTASNVANEPQLGKFPGTGIYKFSEKVARQFTVKRKSVKKVYEKTVWGLTTPNLLKTAHTYFGCSRIRFVPLEDVTTFGWSLSSHFDELQFQPELMSPDSNNGYGELSIFTLAFLEDTGWYKVNYSYRNRFYNYAINAGCEFLRSGCYEWIRERQNLQKSILPFCNIGNVNSKSISCSNDHESMMVCPISNHSYPISDNHLYFKELPGIPPSQVPNHYFKSNTTEHCPMYQIPSFNSYITSCKNADNYHNMIISKFGGWKNYFGNDSICVNIYDKFKKYSTSTWIGFYGAICIKYICDGRLNSLTFLTPDMRPLARCLLPGNIVSFDFDKYSQVRIVCPNPTDFCKKVQLSNIKRHRLLSLGSRNQINLRALICSLSLSTVLIKWFYIGL